MAIHDSRTIPVEMAPTYSQIKFCKEHGLDVQHEWLIFVGSHRNQWDCKADWSRTFDKWLERSSKRRIKVPYPIRFSCGHVNVIDMAKTSFKKRGYVIARKEGLLCRRCYLLQIERMHKLPSLKGTDKQISYARSIRASRVHHAHSKGDMDVISTMHQHLDAKYWIELGAPKYSEGVDSEKEAPSDE